MTLTFPAATIILFIYGTLALMTYDFPYAICFGGIFGNQRGLAMAVMFWRKDNDDEREPEKPLENLRVIYSNLENFFETEKPYLDSGLTINEVSKDLLTNKTYLSRALSEIAGLNFCQYVNSHRVRYSMELFCMDESLSVEEIAQRSGFHSVSTFTLAFRAVVHEAPGEWCRHKRIQMHGGGSLH